MASATKLVEVRITYAHPDTQPPVYLAGAFSDPQWQPREMQYTTDEHNQHQFFKEIEVEQGQDYEYKFRLGPGDWWVLDEEGDTATDGAGNRNNVLRVPVREEKVEVVEEKTQEALKDATFLSLTGKDEPVVETAEISPVEVAHVQELQEHESPQSKPQVVEQDSAFLKQLDGNAETESTDDLKVVIPEGKGGTSDTKIKEVIEQPRETSQSNVVVENVTALDVEAKQLDGHTSVANTPLTTKRESDADTAIGALSVETHEISKEWPVSTHDLKDDTYVRQYDGASAVEERTPSAELSEKVQQYPTTEDVQPILESKQADFVELDHIEVISQSENEKSNDDVDRDLLAQETRKDSVIDVDNEAQNPASKTESHNPELMEVVPSSAGDSGESSTSEAESVEISATGGTHSVNATESAAVSSPDEAVTKDVKTEKTIKPSGTRSNAPSAIDLPPRDSHVKSRSPSPGQLFSKAHLLRLQEKSKSPPIQEDAAGQDYVAKSILAVRPSSTRSVSGESVGKVAPLSELPRTPPMSRRTSSKTKSSPRPALLSEVVGRSISDGLPTSKERVFPLKRQKSEGAPSQEEPENEIASVITETNTFDGTSLPVNVDLQNFHQYWSPLDWNPEAKAKYEEQQLRLEKIRRPLNHYYDAEKSAHRDLLNSKRGQTLHSLYNQRQAKSNVATQETKDMWKYIRHLREERRYKTSKNPNNIPLSWVFHLDEPQHPRYTPEALDEHIHVVEDEIAFYTHREKVEAGTGGDRPNSWYSPASFDFVAEHRYLGSANGSSRRSKNGSERGRKSSSEYAATWKQKQAQIIAKKGDIFSKNDNPQLDLLTRLDATGVETNDPASEAPSSDWAHSLNQRLGNVIDSESDQDTSDQSRKQSSSSQGSGSGSSQAEPSNLTPLHVGNHQLEDEQRTLRPEGNGPQINLHPATPAPPSKDTEQDSKQLGHSSNDSKDKLKTSNSHKRNLSERSVTPSSLHTAGHDSKHSKNVFRAFLRFVFVEFWRGLFQKLTRFGKGPANV